MLLTLTQSRLLREENRDVVRALMPLSRLRTALTIVIIVISFCAWALYDVLRLGQVQFVFALVAVVVIIVFLGSSVPYWNRILAYSRGEYKAEQPQSVQ